MPPGRSSWLRRSVGLALARAALRRALEGQGPRGQLLLATVVARPIEAPEAAREPAE